MGHDYCNYEYRHIRFLILFWTFQISQAYFIPEVLQTTFIG